MSTVFSAPALRARVRSYSLDGDVILFDEPRARLFALNSTASFIWRELAAGMAPETIARALGDEAGVSIAQAARDIDMLIGQWQQAGVIGPNDGDRDEPQASTPAPGPQSAAPALAVTAPESRLDGGAAFTSAFRLMDAGVQVRADAESAELVAGLFAHLTVPKEQAGADWPVLEVFKQADQWVVALNGVELGRCRNAAELVPLIYGNGSMLAYQASDCYAVIHAAAVSAGSSAVLMPGLPGSGKSTLAAALIASGYAYCTDDLAVLSADPVRLRPVPLPMGLKRGSWGVLDALWPQLAGLPVHRRADGKLVKYLLPTGLAPNGTAERDLAVTAMVFPKYMPGAAAGLEPIARSEALARMTAAGYDLPGMLDDAFVRAMIEWFEGLSCYELRFDDLGAAVDAFSGVLR